MDVYEALYTTRAMRRCRPDPIPDDVQARILDAAIRAPSGGNTQNWRFMLVDDPALRDQLGPIYRDCLAQLWASIYKDRIDAANAAPDHPDNAQMLRIQRSAQHLADHFEEYPLLLFSFVQFDPTGGSIFPATWSAMLAARAEGIGTSLTSVFLFRLDDVLQLLRVPKEDGWLFSSCVTFGYPTGRWGVAPRRPVHEVTFRNGWGEPLGFEVPEPLWPGNAGMNDGDTSALALAGLLATAGATHFFKPDFYDPIVPHALPMSPRTWTLVSGVAELGVAALVAHPRTRAAGGLLAAGLFAAVFPANVQMAYDWRDRDARDKAVAYGRLPLQGPLVWWAMRVSKRART